MVRAILFDFDGTIAHTLPLCFEAFQNVFRSFDGRELTDTDVIKMFGPSETGIIHENLQHEDRAGAIELYYETYSKRHHECVAQFPKMRELLLELKQKDYLLGIVTGKARRSLDLSLEALKLQDVFDTVITGDDVNKPKPHPEGIKKALKELTINKEEAFYLGDSDADILAGKEAGVKTIAVYWLPDYQPTLTVTPDWSLQHVDELKSYLPTR